MDLFEGHRKLNRALSAPAVTLGNFDGFHRGHQELVATARRAANRHGGEIVVYTFDPHPARVLAPKRAPALICSRSRKLELLAAAGVDVCILEPFTREFAEMSPEQFFADVLVGALGSRALVVGYDFTFGKNRAGNIDSLKSWSRERGVDLDVVSAIEVDGAPASSTAVRRAVQRGDLATTRALLGRTFDLEGTVVTGARRGRELGFPTANVAIESELLPAVGIYAVRFQVEEDGRFGPLLPGAASLGTNPTFDGDRIVLEVHVLDFDEELYGRRVRVQFVEMLRDEARFESVDALIEQIQRDIVQARIVLSRTQENPDDNETA